MSQATEREILRAVMDWLAAKRIFAVRMNSGTQIGSHAGKKWAIHMNAPGTADLLAFVTTNHVHGPERLPMQRVYWLECKTATGKQSPLQKSFQAQVEAEGHRYRIVRSIEDLEEALR